MKRLTLCEVFSHPIAQKYLNRSGVAHAVSATYHAFRLANERGVDVDSATKAALLHDIGHYEWYNDGQWDYDSYRQFDIHAIKGAERAHKLLIRLGEERAKAREISLAVLLHTDSYFAPGNLVTRTPLQEIVYLADTADEEPGGKHHYRQMTYELAMKKLGELDEKIELLLQKRSSISQ